MALCALVLFTLSAGCGGSPCEAAVAKAQRCLAKVCTGDPADPALCTHKDRLEAEAITRCSDTCAAAMAEHVVDKGSCRSALDGFTAAMSVACKK
jgi:hypothetical protein